MACLSMIRYERAVLFVPHGWNTAVGLAADLQLVAAVPVARWVEYITPAPYIEDLVSGKLFPYGFVPCPANMPCSSVPAFKRKREAER